MTVNHNHPNSHIHKFADIALDVGTYLLSCGAHSGRVKSNIERLANAWGFSIDLNPSFKGLLVSISEKKGFYTVTE